MNMKTTITEIQNNIPVFFIQAESFPDGITEAHDKFRDIIGQGSGRILYGISRPEFDKIIYRAGAEEKFPGEGAEYKCGTMQLKKGRYISKRLLSYRENPGSIGEAFETLLGHPDIDPKGYCVEQYLNENEMICMIRLKD